MHIAVTDVDDPLLDVARAAVDVSKAATRAVALVRSVEDAFASTSVRRVDMSFACTAVPIAPMAPRDKPISVWKSKHIENNHFMNLFHATNEFIYYATSTDRSIISILTLPCPANSWANNPSGPCLAVNPCLAKEF